MKVIDGFWLRFENGKAVEFGARDGEEALAQLLSYDEGSAYLGEVALVPYDSPVSQSGILFFNTLYDENAACHLALGRPYPENIEGGETMSKEELAARGANDSMQHVDFMIGTRSTSQGFTTTHTMSAVSAANLLSVVTLTPVFANLSTTACEGSLTVMSSFLNCWPLMRPSTVAPPMAPAPITAIFIMSSLSG